MKNVALPPDQFEQFKLWLRGQEGIKWRDISSACLIPSWGETICNEDFMIGDLSCAQYGYKVIQEHNPGLSLKWRKEEMYLLDYRPPWYFEGLYTGPVWHLDIIGAYSQFYRHLYWHSEWPYKRQKYPLWGIAEHFSQQPQTPKFKIARNSIVGIARSTRNKWVQGANIWYTNKVNKYLSPTLWGQLQGILSQIAGMMLEYGAIWINTDGYAFKDEFGFLMGKEFLDSEGIAYRENFGIGTINGIASMNVPGVKVTKDNNPSKPINRVEPAGEINHLLNYQSNRRNNNE